MKKTIKILTAFFFALSLFNTGYNADASFLEDTAGISASAELGPVNLELAETAFKNIEIRDNEYIVGSVALDGYDESFDVHIYLTSSGNIVAYYLNDVPASKIVDWVGYSGGEMTLEGSNLEDAMTNVCQTIGQALPSVTYYDFRYPTATNFEIIADEELSRTHETFQYQIPLTHIIQEASWSFASSVANASYSNDNVLRIDGVLINLHNNPPLGWTITYDIIPSTYLSKEVFHEVDIHNDSVGYDAYTAIVFIYNE